MPAQPGEPTDVHRVHAAASGRLRHLRPHDGFRPGVCLAAGGDPRRQCPAGDPGAGPGPGAALARPPRPARHRRRLPVPALRPQAQRCDEQPGPLGRRAVAARIRVPEAGGGAAGCGAGVGPRSLRLGGVSVRHGGGATPGSRTHRRRRATGRWQPAGLLEPAAAAGRAGPQQRGGEPGTAALPVPRPQWGQPGAGVPQRRPGAQRQQRPGRAHQRPLPRLAPAQPGQPARHHQPAAARTADPWP